MEIQIEFGKKKKTVWTRAVTFKEASKTDLDQLVKVAVVLPSLGCW